MLKGEEPHAELHAFDRSSVIGDHCCKEVIIPLLRLFREAIVPDFAFMDDNALSHQTVHVLENEDIAQID
ncbi:hypothetical protein TNCV_730261 [Trichonephila clavipes]|nr:hypothetical protein TNCV_730261 [Trichonephila clavipes]